MEIEELQTQEEWREAFPVMRELRTTLDEQAYLCLIAGMVKEGYRLFALRLRTHRCSSLLSEANEV